MAVAAAGTSMYANALQTSVAHCRQNARKPITSRLHKSLPAALVCSPAPQPAPSPRYASHCGAGSSLCLEITDRRRSGCRSPFVSTGVAMEKSEKQRMIDGEFYNAWVTELTLERVSARSLVQKYNATTGNPEGTIR